MNERLLREWVGGILLEQQSSPIVDVRAAAASSPKIKSLGTSAGKKRKGDAFYTAQVIPEVNKAIKDSGGTRDALEDGTWKSNPAFKEVIDNLVASVPGATLYSGPVKYTHSGPPLSAGTGSPGITLEIPNGDLPLFISLYLAFGARSDTAAKTQSFVGLAIWTHLQNKGWTAKEGVDPVTTAPAQSGAEDVILQVVDPDGNPQKIQVEVKNNNAYIYDKTMTPSGGTTGKKEGAAAIDGIAKKLARLQPNWKQDFPRAERETGYGIHHYIEDLRNSKAVRQWAKCEDEDSPAGNIIRGDGSYHERGKKHREAGEDPDPKSISLPGYMSGYDGDPTPDLGCEKSLPGYGGQHDSAERSGSLPKKYFRLKRPPASGRDFAYVTLALTKHWKASGDQYVAVVSGEKAYLWWTGEGENLLLPVLGKIPKFTHKAYASVAMDPGSATNAMRVQLEIAFNLTDGKLLEMPKSNEGYNMTGKNFIREYIRESLLLEELTKSDRKEIEKITRKQIKRDIIDKKEIQKIARKEAETEIKKSLGASFLGTPGKINQAIQDIAREELQTALKGKELEKAAADVTKRVLYAFYKMMYNRKNLIDQIKF